MCSTWTCLCCLVCTCSYLVNLLCNLFFFAVFPSLTWQVANAAFVMKMFEVLFCVVDSPVLLASTLLSFSCDLVSQGNHVNRCFAMPQEMCITAIGCAFWAGQDSFELIRSECDVDEHFFLFLFSQLILILCCDAGYCPVFNINIAVEWFTAIEWVVCLCWPVGLTLSVKHFFVMQIIMYAHRCFIVKAAGCFSFWPNHVIYDCFAFYICSLHFF